MPLHLSQRIVAAKIETTPGTAISLAGTDCNYICYNPKYKAESEFVERERSNAYGRHTGRTSARMATITFLTDLIPGSGASAAWIATFFPACGLVLTSSTWSPVTAFAGTGGVKTLTMAIYHNGKVKTIRGAMGNVKLVFESGKVVMLEWEFKGAVVDAADATLLVPSAQPTLKPLKFIGSTITIGSHVPILGKAELDLGNDVQMRMDASLVGGFSAGYSTAHIAKRKPTLTMDPEAQLVGTKDFQGEWLSDTEQAFSLALSEGNLGYTFAAPKAQLTDVDEGERNGIATEPLTFALNCTATLDDELTIVQDITP